MNLEELRKVPLANFCIEKLSYVPVRGKDSKLWRCLQGPHGLKVIMNTHPCTNGKYLFFSHDTDIKGDIISLLKNLHGYSFRQIVNEFCNEKADTSKFIPKMPIEKPPNLDTSTKIVNKIYQNYLNLCTPSYDNYLMRRGISNEVIKFYSIRLTQKEFMLPLYCLQDGVFKVPTAIKYFYNHFNERCRLFLKNLSKNGGYSLLFPKNRPITTFDKLFLFESPIDALSYAQLFPDQRQAIYMSSCGAFGQAFKKQLIKFISNFNITKIKLCFDNDQKGISYVNDLSVLLKNYNITVHLPEKKDWNDELISL